MLDENDKRPNKINNLIYINRGLKSKDINYIKNIRQIQLDMTK